MHFIFLGGYKPKKTFDFEKNSFFTPPRFWMKIIQVDRGSIEGDRSPSRAMRKPINV